MAVGIKCTVDMPGRQGLSAVGAADRSPLRPHIAALLSGAPLPITRRRTEADGTAGRRVGFLARDCRLNRDRVARADAAPAADVGGLGLLPV